MDDEALVKQKAEQEAMKDMDKATRIRIRANMPVEIRCTGTDQYEWIGCTQEDFDENPGRVANFERAVKRECIKNSESRTASIKEQLRRDGTNEVFD